MNKEHFFFSSDNLELLYNVLKQDIESNFNYNLDNNENYFKTNLLNVMNSVYTNHKDTNIKGINTKVIENSAPIFINKIKDEYSRTELKGNGIRDSEIIDRSTDLIKQTKINIRPQPSIEYNNNNLDNELTKMNSIRDEFTDRPKLVQDDFRLPQDNEQTQEEIEQELYKRQQELTNGTVELKNNTVELRNNNVELTNDLVELSNYNKTNTDIYNSNKVEMVNQNISMEISRNENYIIPDVNTNMVYNRNIENNISGIQGLPENASFIDKRNNETMEIINENKLVDPNEIYKKGLEDNSKMEQYLNERLNTKETPLDLLIPNSEIKYNKNTNLVSVSSIDRNWEKDGNENRYEYSVFFSPASNQWEKVPIYENNKTIPQNQQQYDNGVLGDINNSGWESANGEKYVKFDGQKPSGNVIGYDTILITGNNNTKIDNIYKNIYSIELVLANLPIDNIIVANNDNMNINIYSFPYLLLNIKEIGGLYSSTNNEISNCFCKLMIDNSIRVNSTQRGYEIFKPSANEKKIYGPKPLDILSKLSITLLTPEGKLLSSENDVYGITKIEIKDTPTTTGILANKKYFISMELSEYFNIKFLQKTDLILLKNIKIKHNDFTTNMEMRNMRDQFIKYLEETAGHYVIEIDEKNIYNLSKTIYINNNGKMNNIIGSFELDMYDNPDKYETFLTLLSNSNISGKLINISLQNTFTFKITTNEIDYRYDVN